MVLTFHSPLSRTHWMCLLEPVPTAYRRISMCRTSLQPVWRLHLSLKTSREFTSIHLWTCCLFTLTAETQSMHFVFWRPARGWHVRCWPLHHSGGEQWKSTTTRRLCQKSSFPRVFEWNGYKTFQSSHSPPSTFWKVCLYFYFFIFFFQHWLTYDFLWPGCEQLAGSLCSSQHTHDTLYNILSLLFFFFMKKKSYCCFKLKARWTFSKSQMVFVRVFGDFFGPLDDQDVIRVDVWLCTSQCRSSFISKHHIFRKMFFFVTSRQLFVH